MFVRETLYRSDRVMAKLKQFPVTICGAGALGANVAENLGRSGFGKLKVIDRDRIEERNLSTQPYYRSDIGAFKTKILTNNLYRSLGIKIDAQSKELTASNAAQLLQGTRLAIDTFDNSVAREAVKDCCDAQAISCLHVGLARDYAEVIWNDRYRVPSPTYDDICDYPLARNLVMLAVSVACEAIVRFVATGAQQSWTITLEDFAIRPYEL